MRGSRNVRVPWITALLLTVAVSAGYAQTGQVAGRVFHGDTGEPLGGVQVYLDGTSRGSVTRADGTFTIQSVPVGTYTVIAQILGFQQQRRTDVQVTDGATATVEFRMPVSVIALQEVVVTGLVDPVEGARSPITVGRVTREQMPVPVSGSAATAVQGRVAGATMVRPSGQPGAEVAMNLRTPTSALGSNQPLIVVDGVILGSSTADIDTQDIESIEVVKGAAAASLYGSRAAAGVISITTNRGRNLAAGTTQFSMRSEVGRSEAADYGRLPRHHFFATDENGNLIDQDGNPTDWAGRYEPPIAFMDKEYTVPLFNNLGQIYRPGNFQTHSFTITSNHENTNLAASVNRYDEEGALAGTRGYQRNAFRVNVDHRFWNTMALSLSAYHARSSRDNIVGGGNAGVGGAFGNFLTVPPFIDLTAKDEDGNYIRVPDPNVDFENPLWRQALLDDEVRTARTLGNANLRWTPTTWFSAAADVSFDRSDQNRWVYTPREVDLGNGVQGEIEYHTDLTDTFNGSIQVSLRRDLGLLNARTTLRALAERVSTLEASAIGRHFLVGGARRIDATRDRDSQSEETEIRSLGYLWETALDYQGKYTSSILVRRDGSSLFGPENRWHNYYRVAGAWRLSEESWFNLPNVTEFKLKASRGTAGGRPAFANQYETWNVGAQGPSKGTLGNRNLRPEHTTENEFGLEMILFGRLGIELVHARQKTTDQIVDVALPASAGYTSQWINSGTMEGHTTELAIEARVINRPNLTWSTNLVGDRSRSKLTEWNQPCFVESTIKVCEGSNPRDIWAYHYLRAGELPAWFQDRANEFDVNDDGYLVWVGEGNTFRDGVAKSLWGTQTSINGHTLRWGLPILETDENGNPIHAIRGRGDPKFQLGWLNTVRWGGFTFHAQLHWSYGNQVMNRTWQYLIYQKNSPEMDQAGKPDELKKPVTYYVDGLYRSAMYVDHFIEDASYLKLRTLSVSYRLGQAQLQRLGLTRLGASSIEIGLIGRNIFSIDNYSGFDPEVVLPADAGLARTGLVPTDFYQYPNTRNYTVTVGVTF